MNPTRQMVGSSALASGTNFSTSRSDRSCGRVARASLAAVPSFSVLGHRVPLGSPLGGASAGGSGHGDGVVPRRCITAPRMCQRDSA